MTIYEFETEVGKRIEDLTVDDLRKISKNEEIMKSLATMDDGRKIIMRIAQVNKNEDVQLDILPALLYYDIYGSEKTLEGMYIDYQAFEDKERLLNEFEKVLKNGQPLEKVNAYIFGLEVLDGFDFTPYKEDILLTIDSVADKLKKLNAERNLQIVCDILDRIYTIQQLYYERYNIDILEKNLDTLNECVSTINKLTEKYYNDLMSGISDNIPDDITPEDIGFLDMTKFGTNGGDLR